LKFPIIFLLISEPWHLPWFHWALTTGRRTSKKKIQPAFKRIGIIGKSWHTFPHTVGTTLAEMGEHQLTIRNYLRHSNLHVTNKYLQATSKTKRVAHDKLVDAFLPAGLLPKANVVQ